MYKQIHVSKSNPRGQPEHRHCLQFVQTLNRFKDQTLCMIDCLNMFPSLLQSNSQPATNQPSNKTNQHTKKAHKQSKRRTVSKRRRKKKGRWPLPRHGVLQSWAQLQSLTSKIRCPLLGLVHAAGATEVDAPED